MLLRARPAPAGLPRRHGLRTPHIPRATLVTLSPTGDGDTSHLDGGGAGVALPPPILLDEGVYELGREEPADLVLPIPTVSTRHALLRVTGGEAVTLSITDLGSTNGTFIIPPGCSKDDEDEVKSLKAMASRDVAPGSTVVFGDARLARFEVVVVGEGSGGGGGGGEA